MTTLDAEPAPPAETLSPEDTTVESTVATLELDIPTQPLPAGTEPAPAGLPEPEPEPRPARPPWRRWTGLWWDLGAFAGLVGVALYLTHRLWRDVPGARGLNGPDEAFFEWMLAHGARVVTQFDYPFVTYRMNAPDGVNLMANTSILGLSIPLSPVTLLFGPAVSFVVLTVLAYAATGLAWYYVLSRHVVTSRLAALVGGAFCAFAPGMVSHGNGHPNIVAQFLVPFIVWRTIRLRESGRVNVVRNGVVLGLLITWQAFINEEVLLLTAMGVGLFTIVAGLSRREWRRQALPFLGGLGLAATVAGALLAYPLWVQFTGPGAYHGLESNIQKYGANLAAYPAFSRLSLAGGLDSVRGLTQNASEENAFLGWPLLLLLGLLVLVMSRRVVAVVAALVGVMFAAASLGPEVRWHDDTVALGPWYWVQQLPIFDTVVPTRFALATAPIAGILLALAWDGWRQWTLAPPRWLYGRWARRASYLVWPAVFVAALLPLVPRPLPDMPRNPAPPLLTNGRLDGYLTGDYSVVFVPPARSLYPDPLEWAAETGLKFRMAHGYFLGPASHDDPDKRYAIFTAPARPTTRLFDWVMHRDRLPRITVKHRREAIEDLQYWQAGVLVQARPEQDALWQLVTDLFRVYPEWVDGAWVWDVRQITDTGELLCRRDDRGRGFDSSICRDRGGRRTGVG